MKVFTGISKAYTFKGFAKKNGVKPKASDFGLIKDAALVVNKKGRVEWIGKEKNLNHKTYPFKITHLKGQNIFPSFTESHTHLAFGGDRKKEFEEKINGKSYLEIQNSGGGISKTVKDTKKESLDQLIKISQKRVDQFKRRGVSLLEIKSGYGQDLKTEMKQLRAISSLKGVKIIPTYLALHSFKGDKNKYVKKVLDKDLPTVLKEFKNLKRLDLFIESSFFDLDDLKLFVDKIKRLDLNFCVHADQLSSSGASLKAARLGALSVEHAVFVKDKELKELSKLDTVMNLLPGADFYLNTPYPKARKMIDAGLKVSLATDYNPGSSPTQDLNFIGLLARRQMKMSLAEVFCAYTLNASRALGFQNKGALVKDYLADFIATPHELEDFFYEVGSDLNLKLYNF